MAIPSRVAANRSACDPHAEVDTDSCHGAHDSGAIRTESGHKGSIAAQLFTAADAGTPVGDGRPGTRLSRAPPADGPWPAGRAARRPCRARPPRPRRTPRRRSGRRAGPPGRPRPVGWASSSRREARSASWTSGSARKAAARSLRMQVVAHAAGRRRPHAVEVLGPRRLEVEVPRARRSRRSPAGRPARTADRRSPAPKRRSWSYLMPDWPLRSMWKSLPAHSAWAMPCGKFSPAICSWPTSGLTPTSSGRSSALDEGQRVADGRQQDVAARLVRLGLDREPQVVALLGDVLAEQVEGLLHPVQRDAHVLGARRTPRPRGRPRRRRSRRPSSAARSMLRMVLRSA